jgi:coenzyme F390 synthetase
MSYYHPELETMERSDLDSLIEERIRYTIHYAAEHSPFYRNWFKEHHIDPGDIQTHEDLLHLPIVNGDTIRAHQPPVVEEFQFLSADMKDIFTIHETSGTSGTPKAFFLSWDDWQRYAEKYSRIFLSQGFGPGDRVVMCASYGMNVGAMMMTLAAHNLGFTVIPEGKCTFPVRVLTTYRPTAVVGSVFKLLRLARKLESEGISPGDIGMERLVVGGESFAEESRRFVSEIWDCPAYNTYGSTEGTMCGECSALAGLHVPEDLVHMDLYDPAMKTFVDDGDCGRIVLTTLLPVGARAGNLLINYDTEDTTVVTSRDRCPCGRTHMRILNPQREAETAWVLGIPMNRVDIERSVFQAEHLDDITGEYEAFLYGNEEEGVTLRVGIECRDPSRCDRKNIETTFLASFLSHKKGLSDPYAEGSLNIVFNLVGPNELELYRVKGRPKRFVDRR